MYTLPTTKKTHKSKSIWDTKQILYMCTNCGDSFLRYPPKKVTNIFCNLKCHHDFYRGKKQSIETSMKKSLSLKGKNKGKISPFKGKTLSIEARNKISKKLKGFNPETLNRIKRLLSNQSMTNIENRVNNILKSNNLPFVFVGNGKYFIESKIPDFINESERIAIEVFYTKHKEYWLKIPIDQWIKQRTEIFNRNGWKVIFLNEKEVNIDSIQRKIKEVSKNDNIS